MWAPDFITANKYWLLVALISVILIKICFCTDHGWYLLFANLIEPRTFRYYLYELKVNVTIIDIV